MTRIPLRSSLPVWLPANVVILIVLLASNVFFQVIGNLAGLASVITITILLRFLPLNVVFPVTTGLTVIGIQLVAAWILFRESISSVQWLGTLLVVMGIALIGGRR